MDAVGGHGHAEGEIGGDAVLAASVRAGRFPVVISDGAFTIQFANEAIRDVGWEPHQLVGQPVFEFVHPADLARAAAGISSAGGGGYVLPAPVRIRRPDGSYHPLDATAHAFHDARGEVRYSFSLTPNPFGMAKDYALEAMVAGDHPGVPLGILAGAFTDHRPGAAVAFDDDGGDPGARAVVGALPGELVGVFDGRQDRSAGAPWTAAEAQPKTLVQVDSLDGLPPAAQRAAEERGLVTGLYISVPDVGRPNPAVLCTWMADPSEVGMIGINLVDLADLAYLALQSRAAREHLDHLAHHDGLTGLANRARFFAALDQALALPLPGCGLALAYLDLDDFKLANDTHGHLAGDHILAEIAARFRTEVRAGDLVARLGGDEFAVLLTCVDGGDDAVAVAHRVRAAAGEPVDVSGGGGSGGVVQLGASAGVAVASDLSGVTADGLVRLADEALYTAKRQGKGSLQVVRWGASDKVVPA